MSPVGPAHAQLCRHLSSSRAWGGDRRLPQRALLSCPQAGNFSSAPSPAAPAGCRCGAAASGRTGSVVYRPRVGCARGPKPVGLSLELEVLSPCVASSGLCRGAADAPPPQLLMLWEVGEPWLEQRPFLQGLFFKHHVL